MFTFGGGWQGIGSPQPGDDDYTLNLTLGERITACTIWVNQSNPPCVGRVKLVTDKGQTLDTAANDTTLGTGFSRPVDGGLLCGLLANFNSVGDPGVCSLCLLFLVPTIVSVSVSKINYAITLSGTGTGITPVARETVKYNTTGQWTFGGSKTRATTNSFTSTSTKAYTASASVEVSGKFLGIGAKATTGFQWTQTEEKSTESSIMESTELN